MDTTHLTSLGWSPFFEQQLEAPLAADQVIARVAAEHRTKYVLLAGEGPVEAIPAGRLHHHAASRAELPAVGDWVIARTQPGGGPAVVVRVLERQSAFTRKQAGPGADDEQVVAANIDYVFLISSLNQEFNLRRIERYLSVALDSGSDPVVLLNKADLCADVTPYTDAVRRIVGVAPYHVISAATGEGLEPVLEYVGPGRTCAAIGSSGVGKSTLVNALVGEARQETAEIRADDDEGRHTTTHRELIPMPSGGLLVDTPGMRELQLWDVEGGVSAAFEDVEALEARCRYRDCTHEGEPGCALLAAVEEGEIERGRLESYHKLQRELAFHARKHDKRESANVKARWKKITKQHRERTRYKGR